MRLRQLRTRLGIKAFTLIELLVVIGTVAILVVMGIPAQAKVRQNAQMLTCMNNLKQISAAFRIWALNHRDRYPMQVTSSQGGPSNATVPFSGNQTSGTFTWQVFQVMSNELSTPKVLVCPSDERVPASNFVTGSYSNVNLSYFVGRDAFESRPRMFLSGDRNIGPAATSTGYGYNADNTAAGAFAALGTNSVTISWTYMMHIQRGNLLCVDGSVQQQTSAKLRSASRVTGDGTSFPGQNCIMFP